MIMSNYNVRQNFFTTAFDSYYATKMSYNRNFVSRISKLGHRLRHNVAVGCGVELPRNLGKTLRRTKVSVMLGHAYDDLDGLVNGRTHKDSGYVSEDKRSAFDVSIMRKMFPSITVGCSPHLELYTDSASHSQTKTNTTSLTHEEFQPLLGDGKGIIPETLTELCSPNERFSESNFSGEPIPGQSDNVEDLQYDFPASEEFLPPLVLENDKSSQLTLDEPISLIEGLSKRQCRQLEDCGIYTLRKLLHHFPRTYADLQNSHMGIEDGQYLIFVGRVVSSRAIKASYSLSLSEVIVRGELEHMRNYDDEGHGHEGQKRNIVYLHLKKFFRGTRFTCQGFLWKLKNNHKEGEIVCVSGKVKGTSKDGHYEMREYVVDVIEDDDDPSVTLKGGPIPIYPSKGGLKAQFFRDNMPRALQSLAANIDPIPQDIAMEIGIIGLRDAYVAIHQPKDLNDADCARKRFVFDEFFYLQLGRMYQMLQGTGSRIEKERLLEKYGNIEQKCTFAEWCDLTKSIFESLPYSLTKSQLRAVSEIIWDLKRPVPMNRLLQGDVGCGKTIVAFLACMEIIGSGYQAAYMVPTELLAFQHYKDLCNLLENLDSAHKPSVALLTGSVPTKQAQMIRNDLQAGTISFVIGTHSLIAESVKFSALRLAVIDEQHRFGVIQRGRFNSKLCCSSTMSKPDSAAFGGKTEKDEILMAPHVLAMSATPIPRSLALALYGDMSLTQSEKFYGRSSYLPHSLLLYGSYLIVCISAYWLSRNTFCHYSGGSLNLLKSK